MRISSLWTMIVYMKMDFRYSSEVEHDKHMAQAGSWVRVPLLKIFLFIFEIYYIFNYIINIKSIKKILTIFDILRQDAEMVE